MGKFVLDRVQGQAGDRQCPRLVFCGGPHGIGLFVLPGKKEGFEKKETELGTGPTQGVQLMGEFLAPQGCSGERFQAQEQLPAEIRPDGPRHFIAGFLTSGCEEIMGRGSW